MTTQLVSMMRSACLSLLVVSCIAPTDGDPLDEEDACATCPVGAADVAFSLEEGSYEAHAILTLVNTATLEVLDHDVPLNRTAAHNIIDGRGAGYSTLEELDAVPYVGPSAMRALARYVEEQGQVGHCGDAVVQADIETCDSSDDPLCPDTCIASHGDGIADDARIAHLDLVHGVRERSYLAAGILRAANELSQSRLDDEVPLDARAAHHIAANRGIGYPSLSRLDEVPYVGPAAFARLSEYAVTSGLVPACGDSDVYAPLEACDDGNLVGGDWCDERCTLESVCGDGVTEGPYEECDDGNLENGDGCDLRCGFQTLQHSDDPTDVGAYRVLRGERDPNGRFTEDWRLTLTAPATLLLTYRDSLNGQALCTSSEGTTQSGRFFEDGLLLDQGGAEIGVFETYGALGPEDRLVVELDAGQYIIRVPAESVCPPGYDGQGISYTIEIELTP